MAVLLAAVGLSLPLTAGFTPLHQELCALRMSCPYPHCLLPEVPLKSISRCCQFPRLTCAGQQTQIPGYFVVKIYKRGPQFPLVCALKAFVPRRVHCT